MDDNFIKKILTVDDIDSNNVLISSYLKTDGVQVLKAESGRDALELISKNHFSLFILDIMMNEMNGYDLAKKIREIDDCKFIPIIFVTGIYNDTLSVLKGYESGAIDYLVKPIRKEILCSKVNFFLTLDRQKDEIIEQKNKLIENHKLFLDITNSSSDLIWEIDCFDKYIYISDKIENNLGYNSSDFIGKSFFDLMPKQEADRIKFKFYKIKSEEAPIKNLINWVNSKDGELVCLLTNGLPVYDEKKNLTGYRGVDKNITSEIESKNQLFFHEKLLKNVYDSIIYTDLEGIIQYVNNGTTYTYGYQAKDLMGKTLALLFPEQYKDLSIKEFSVVIDFKPYKSVWQGRNSNNELIWLDVKISLMHSFDNKPEGYIIVSRDISPIVKAKEDVIRSLISGADNERKRIASDLHDGLGQILTASLFSFNSIEKDIFNNEKLLAYNSGINLLNDAINETRNIAHNLMPKIIEQFGLITSVKSLFNSVKNIIDSEISFSDNIGDKRFNSLLEMNMYRITQEILNNAIKYSKAKKLCFQYQIYNNDFIFTYEDDGIGFDPDEYKSDNKGHGINNIKNRVTAMSGFISINSKIAKGTSISIEICI